MVFSTLVLYIAERMIIRILIKILISEYTDHDTRENVAHSLSTDIIFSSWYPVFNSFKCFFFVMKLLIYEINK